MERTRLETATTLDSMLSTISEVQYSHFYTQRELDVKRKALLEQEELLRKKRDAHFPASLDAYHAIVHKDIRVRIASYLVADEQTKEQMRVEFNWASMQCRPLEIQFTQNVGIDLCFIASD